MAAKKQTIGKSDEKSKAARNETKRRANKAKAKAEKSGKSKTSRRKKRKPKPKAAIEIDGRRSVSRRAGLDKSVEQFRASLERNVTLSRDRLQEVVDDAVKRGRMTRSDAEKMLSDLIKRGRRQTDSLLKELERLVKQARKRSAADRAGAQTGDAGRRAREETRVSRHEPARRYVASSSR